MTPSQPFPPADDEASSIPALANGHQPEILKAEALNNYEDGSHAEPRRSAEAAEREVQVEILERDSDATESTESEEANASEQSSSFGNSFSGRGEESDTEVQSACANGGFVLAGFDRVFPKKRVTDHWRRFIRPIMWRCQWLELRMKELQAQALKYDKELAGYKHEKQLHSKVVELHNSASRVVPLTSRSIKKQVMRRQKRKRTEEAIDASSYLAKHNIFSYYENKKSEVDAPSVDNDLDGQDENGQDDLEWAAVHFRLRDSSLEEILLDVESVLGRVVRLRSRLNEVMCKNVIDISSAPGNSFPGHLPSNCAQSPSFSPDIDGGAMHIEALNIPTLNLSEYEIEEMGVPGSAVSSYGDAADLDMFDSSMSLFPSTEITVNQRVVGDLLRHADDDVLISNHNAQQADDDVFINSQVAQQELKASNNSNHKLEKPHETIKEEDGSSEEVSTAPKALVQEQHSEREKLSAPILKPCYTGKKRGRKPKKRRRGGLAAGSGVKKQRVQT